MMEKEAEVAKTEEIKMSVVELDPEETWDEGKLLRTPVKTRQQAGPSSEGEIVPQTEIKRTTQYNGEGESDACGVFLQVLSLLVIVLFFPFSLLCCLKMVQEYERAVIFRLGRILEGGAKGPGLFFVYPCMDSVITVDLRTRSFDINPQEILTKDHVTVSVDAVMYCRIIDPVASVTRVEDVTAASKLLGATTLRNVLGTKNMTELLSQRDEINAQMKILLDEATDQWGMDVERVEIVDTFSEDDWSTGKHKFAYFIRNGGDNRRCGEGVVYLTSPGRPTDIGLQFGKACYTCSSTDVHLPEQLQRAMAAEAEATREARAKVIAAEGEQKASRALKEAADVMSESPATIQLRYLQTLNTIASEKNSTIIFPLPIDLLSAFKGGAEK